MWSDNSSLAWNRHLWGYFYHRRLWAIWIKVYFIFYLKWVCKQLLRKQWTWEMISNNGGLHLFKSPWVTAFWLFSFHYFIMKYYRHPKGPDRDMVSRTSVRTEEDLVYTAVSCPVQESLKSHWMLHLVFISVYVCTFLCICWVFVDTYRGQNRASDPLELQS